MSPIALPDVEEITVEQLRELLDDTVPCNVKVNLQGQPRNLDCGAPAVAMLSCKACGDQLGFTCQRHLDIIFATGPGWRLWRLDCCGSAGTSNEVVKVDPIR